MAAPLASMYRRRMPVVPPATIINFPDWGTNSRPSEASRFLGAATDGSTAFLGWDGHYRRRIEDLGDGNGPMLCLEGKSTSLAS